MTAYPDVPDPGVSSDPALLQLLEQLRERFHHAICGTLLYGSCLRSGDIYDGLLDLYLICDNYQAAYRRPLMAASNWMLPPNVFYAELTPDSATTGSETSSNKTLRSKVTVISLHDFQRGCSRAWFESYIWGRFSQPTRIIYSRDQQAHNAIEEALLQAARTLLYNSIPAQPTQGSLTNLWERSLGLSYETELRSERNGRARELAQSSREFYATITRHHVGSLGCDFSVYDEDGEPHYRSQVSPHQRRWCSLKWALRRGQGKLLSIIRLVKALFTFEGGLDYLAWKLERHSGEKVIIPDKVRRAPLIFLWGFSWDLYKRGLFK